MGELREAFKKQRVVFDNTNTLPAVYIDWILWCKWGSREIRADFKAT